MRRELGARARPTPKASAATPRALAVCPAPHRFGTGHTDNGLPTEVGGRLGDRQREQCDCCEESDELEVRGHGWSPLCRGLVVCVRGLPGPVRRRLGDRQREQRDRGAKSDELEFQVGGHGWFPFVWWLGRGRLAAT